MYYRWCLTAKRQAVEDRVMVYVYSLAHTQFEVKSAHLVMRVFRVFIRRT